MSAYLHQYCEEGGLAGREHEMTIILQKGLAKPRARHPFFMDCSDALYEEFYANHNMLCLPF